MLENYLFFQPEAVLHIVFYCSCPHLSLRPNYLIFKHKPINRRLHNIKYNFETAIIFKKRKLLYLETHYFLKHLQSLSQICSGVSTTAEFSEERRDISTSVEKIPPSEL